MNFHITYIDAKNIKYDPATDNAITETYPSPGIPVVCYTSIFSSTPEPTLLEFYNFTWNLTDGQAQITKSYPDTPSDPIKLDIGLKTFLLSEWQTAQYPQPLDINQVRDRYIGIIVYNSKTVPNPLGWWPFLHNVQDLNMILIGPGYCHNNKAQIAKVYFYLGADPNAHTVITV